MLQFTADFSFPEMSGFGMHPAASSVGVGGLSPGLKIPGPKAKHPSASGNEVLNEWSYTSSSPYAFMTCTFTFRWKQHAALTHQ